ncbi:MAG: phosphoglycerate kinase [Pseudomonadota bacterium]
MTISTMTADKVAGKTVLVRADLNVPMREGIITNDARLRAIMPSLDLLGQAGAKTILISHLGRPKGKPDPTLSLAPVARGLQEVMGRPVGFCAHTTGAAAARAIAALSAGDVLVLENLRFAPGEEANDSAFAQALADLGEIYVNDGFSVSHRAHASTHELARRLPAFAGLALARELAMLARVLEKPDRPLMALVGGAKVSTKLGVLHHLLSQVDVLAIGGAMANTFLLAQDLPIGASLAEHEMTNQARTILDQAAAQNRPVLLPIDVVVASELKPALATAIKPVHEVASKDMILDLGPATVAAWTREIDKMRTLVWNGPVGAFEVPPFDRASVDLAHTIAARVRGGSLACIGGGGDTLACLAKADVIEDMTYVSTAGGAFLEWLEGRELPGVAVLSS